MEVEEYITVHDPGLVLLLATDAPDRWDSALRSLLRRGSHVLGVLCTAQDEFIFHMLEQLDVKTDVEFKKIIDTYNERIDQGERALKLRKV